VLWDKMVKELVIDAFADFLDNPSVFSHLSRMIFAHVFEMTRKSYEEKLEQISEILKVECKESKDVLQSRLLASF